MSQEICNVFSLISFIRIDRCHSFMLYYLFRDIFNFSLNDQTRTRLKYNKYNVSLKEKRNVLRWLHSINAHDAHNVSFYSCLTFDKQRR